MIHITLYKRPIHGQTADIRNQAICAAYGSGKTVVECMEQFKLGRERVYQILRKNGMALQKRRPSIKDVAQINASFEVENCAMPELSEFEISLKDSGATRKFRLLSEASQSTVKTMFERHKRACAIVGCQMDPYYLPDVVMEAKRLEGKRLSI